MSLVEETFPKNLGQNLRQVPVPLAFRSGKILRRIGKKPCPVLMMPYTAELEKPGEVQV